MNCAAKLKFLFEQYRQHGWKLEDLVLGHLESSGTNGAFTPQDTRFIAVSCLPDESALLVEWVDRTNPDYRGPARNYPIRMLQAGSADKARDAIYKMLQHFIGEHPMSSVSTQLATAAPQAPQASGTRAVARGGRSMWNATNEVWAQVVQPLFGYALFGYDLGAGFRMYAIPTVDSWSMQRVVDQIPNQLIATYWTEMFFDSEDFDEVKLMVLVLSDCPVEVMLFFENGRIRTEREVADGSSYDDVGQMLFPDDWILLQDIDDDDDAVGYHPQYDELREYLQTDHVCHAFDMLEGPAHTMALEIARITAIAIATDPVLFDVCEARIRQLRELVD